MIVITGAIVLCPSFQNLHCCSELGPTLGNDALKYPEMQCLVLSKYWYWYLHKDQRFPFDWLEQSSHLTQCSLSAVLFVHNASHGEG